MTAVAQTLYRTHDAYNEGISDQTVTTTGHRIRADQLRAGLLIRTPGIAHGQQGRRWARVARIETNEHGEHVLYGVDGHPIGSRVSHRWPGEATFEIGKFSDDDVEQAARSFATDPARRGWHIPPAPLGMGAAWKPRRA